MWSSIPALHPPTASASFRTSDTPSLIFPSPTLSLGCENDERGIIRESHRRPPAAVPYSVPSSTRCRTYHSIRTLGFSLLLGQPRPYSSCQSRSRSASFKSQSTCRRRRWFTPAIGPWPLKLDHRHTCDDRPRNQSYLRITPSQSAFPRPSVDNSLISTRLRRV